MVGSEFVFLAKAEENVEAARSELVNRRFNSCASRCYYACFQAAIYALIRTGVNVRAGQWSHRFVQAEFAGRLINREKVYPAHLRTVMEENYALRITADYTYQHVNESRASRAVARTTDFVATLRSSGGQTT